MTHPGILAGKNILILGAQSAVAQSFARICAGQAATIALVGRNPERLADIKSELQTLAMGQTRISCHVHDLAEEGTDHHRAIAAMAKSLDGRLDIILLFQGFLGQNAVAEESSAEAARILNTNLTSAALWGLAAARQISLQKSGVLVFLGSVAGDRGRRSNYIYGTAKSALEVLAQGLNHRFSGTQARAILIKPGFIDTPMTDMIDKPGFLWVGPETIARNIESALSKSGEVFYAPVFWRWIMLVIRLIPKWLFNRLNI